MNLWLAGESAWEGDEECENWVLKILHNIFFENGKLTFFFIF